MIKIVNTAIFLLSIFISFSCSGPDKTKVEEDDLSLPEATDAATKNIVFILSDDHRYDFMGFTGKVPFLETPNMDKMALEGIHLENAFVTTSLCSPSRASILTGLFSHRHGVVDNQTLVPDSLIFFPQYLQKTGYETGFVGKWHMGAHHDDPRKGFDYWASFKGQGTYYNPSLNVNGERVNYEDSSYVTDVLTDHALNFLQNRDPEKKFFLYLSHKAVHAEFLPAKRHKNKYADGEISYPPTMHPPEDGEESDYNYEDVPEWVKEQRYSWHGVDYMYHGQIKFNEFYRRYCESLLALDESIGKVLNYLENNDLIENTLVFYMGDNGFSFGEHGLIDKRHAYEESIRVPLLIYGGDPVVKASKIRELVQNIDIAPTILEMAGLSTPAHMDGMSFFPLLRGESIEWRDRIYYEYFWERPFPQTPTMHAVRTERYKYIRYHGVWDINGLYDLQVDPWEMNNLIRMEEHFDRSKKLNEDIFTWLESTNGLKIPLRGDPGPKFDHKHRDTY